MATIPAAKSVGFIIVSPTRHYLSRMTVLLACPALCATYQLKALGVSVVTAVEPDVQDMTPPAIVSGDEGGR
jgi:hypothetical protein